jgi:hypothetical protein
MKLTIVAVVLIANAAGSTVVGAPRQQLIGQWQQSDLVGPGRSSEQCTWLRYQTRKIQVEPAPTGEIVGVYTIYEQSVWTLRGAETCAFERPTISNALFQRARMWSIRLAADDDALWRMSADAAQCSGDWCDEAGLFRSPFTTRLRSDAGKLIDAGAGVAGGGELTFRPVAVASNLADSAAAAWPGLLRPYDEGECNAFVAQSVHSSSPLKQHQIDFCSLARQMKSIQTQPVVGSSVLNTIPLDRVLLANGSSAATDDVLIIGTLDFQDGSKAPRVSRLRRQEGTWKVFAQFAQ